MSQSLTLIDIEDFIPLLPLDKDVCNIDNDGFIAQQYAELVAATSDDAANDYRLHNKLDALKQLICGETSSSSTSKLKNKLRRNFLYNLVYHKYQFDISGIKNQTVFNNYYFEPAGNGMLKQIFVAMTQILFTVLLLFEIIELQMEGLIDFEHNLNAALAVTTTYLAVYLIEPQISSIIDDYDTLQKYFRLNTLNLVVNIATNIVVAVLLPAITFFLILMSKSMIEIVLNATAIAFIIELDDIVSHEVDFENWFISTANASFEAVFKKGVAFNDSIITDNHVNIKDIMQTIENMREHLKDINKASEYTSINKIDLCLSFAADILKLAFSPIVIFVKYPYLIINRVCCNCSNGDDKYAYGESASHEQQEQRFGNQALLRSKRRSSLGFEPVNSDDFDEYFGGGDTPIEHAKTDEFELHTKTEQSTDDQHVHQAFDHEPGNLVKCLLLLNAEGNECANNYMFSEAVKKYESAIEKARSLPDYRNDEIYVKIRRIIPILYYNAGYAFCERAKQSFISEIITNRNGHTYRNYTKCIDYFKKCVNCIERAEQTLNNKKRVNQCRETLSDVYFDLYEFVKSLYEYNEIDDAHKRMHRLKEIEGRIEAQRGMTRTFRSMLDYYSLLDDFRKTLAEVYNSGDETKMDEELLHKLKNCSNLYKDANLSKTDEHKLEGKLLSLRSEFYLFKYKKVMQIKEEKEEMLRQLGCKKEEYGLTEMEEKEEMELMVKILSLKSTANKQRKRALSDAEKANKCSKLYGWILLSLSQMMQKFDDEEDEADPADIDDIDDEEVVLERGKTLMFAEETLCADIINEYTNQIEFDSIQPYYYYVRGRAHYALKELQPALDDFLNAARLEPKNPVFWMRAGQCQFELGDTDAAIKLFQKQDQGIGDLYTANTKVRLLAAFYEASSFDQEEGMSEQEYILFLNNLEQPQVAMFEELGSFEDLKGDDNLIHAKQFETYIEQAMNLQTHRAFLVRHVYQGLLSEWEYQEEICKYFDDEKAAENRIQQIRDRLVRKNRKEYYQHGQEILRRVMDTVEFDDDNAGLSKQEFERGLSLLSPSLVTAFDLDDADLFEQYCGEDGVMDWNAFETLCDDATAKMMKQFETST